MAKSYKYRRKRKAHKLEDIQLRLSEAIDYCEKIILSDGYTADAKLKAVHALVQSAGAYSRLTESIELEERIQELEALAKEQGS